MTKFQIIIIAIFVLFAAAGVAAFAFYKGNTSQNDLPTITVWGTMPSETFDNYITQLDLTRPVALKINYVQENESTFNNDFVKALARGVGPDAILIPQDMIYPNEDKLVLVPYTTLPQRTFTDTFIPQANLYLRSDGITALPFAIDPLVMYWNKDTFINAGIAGAGTVSSPLKWSRFGALGAKMTVKDNNSNIRKSVVALGQFSNVDHAREILGTLFMQAGNPVTVRTADNSIISALGNGTYTGLVSSATALSFFIRFTDPSDANYSWNRSLPDSQSDFLAGNLATYFGFASELGQLRNQNPNLNFDVAPMPQADNGKVRIEYGKMYGFSFVKNSPNVATAYSVLSSLVAPDAQSLWVKQASLPPVRRDMISSGTTDPYLSIFYDAALISNGWLDPQPQSTSVLFQRMTDSVVSGASVINDALQNTSNALDLNIKNI